MAQTVAYIVPDKTVRVEIRMASRPLSVACPCGVSVGCLYQTEARRGDAPIRNHKRGIPCRWRRCAFRPAMPVRVVVQKGDFRQMGRCLYVYGLLTDAHNTYNATYLGDRCSALGGRWMRRKACICAPSYDGVNGICCWRLFTDKADRETYLEQMLATGLDFCAVCESGRRSSQYVNRYGGS